MATMPQCQFTIRYWQSEKKRRNCDWRVIWKARRAMGAGRRLISHRGVSDSSDGARPLWRSHSAQMEMFFAAEYGQYEWIWEICSMGCLMGFRRPCIGDVPHGIGCCTCHTANNQWTHTLNYSISKFRMKISSVSSYISLPHPQLYHHLRRWRQVIPHYFSRPQAWVNTKCNAHRVLHTQSTAYTKYFIHRALQISCTAYSECPICWVLHTPCTAYAEYCIHWVLQYPTIDYVLRPGCLSSVISHLLANLVVLNTSHSHDSELSDEINLSSHRASLEIYHLQINNLQLLFQS